MAPHPKWHGRTAHGVSFQAASANLFFTFKVEQDKRSEHPRGYVAFTQNWGGEILRIDFEHGLDAAGNDMLYLVTAMKREVRG